MTRQVCLSVLAIGFFAAATAHNTAQAQTISIGRGGVQYNGYGQGYYGGYGQGYREYQGFDYGPRTYTNVYSGYGNGPYGYGSGSAYQYPANRGYGYGNGAYYNGYGNSGYYQQPYSPVYRPYGYGVYIQ